MSFPEITVIMKDKAGNYAYRCGSLNTYLSIDVMPTKNVYTEAHMPTVDPEIEGFYADIYYQTPQEDGADGYLKRLVIEKYARIYFFTPEDAASVELVLDGERPIMARLFGTLVDLRRCSTYVSYCGFAWNQQNLLTNIVSIADALKKQYSALGDGDPNDISALAETLGITKEVLLGCYAVVAAMSKKQTQQASDDVTELFFEKGSETNESVLGMDGDYDPYMDEQ